MKLKDMTITALATALIFVTTIMIQIPNGIGGYIHFGDALLLLFAMLLSPRSAYLSAALGSSLADLLSGYTIYVIPTFIIKVLMGLCFSYFYDETKKTRTWMGFLLCASILILGYFITEVCLYQSISVAAISILPNAIQIGSGIIISLLLKPFLSKVNQTLVR